MNKLLLMTAGLLMTTTSNFQARFDTIGIKLNTEVKSVRVDIEPVLPTEPPMLINMGKIFSFDTSGTDYKDPSRGKENPYTVNDPDHRDIYPKYRAKGDEKTTPVNRSFVRPWAIDETGMKFYFPTANSLGDPISIGSNGRVYFGFDSYANIPSNCSIHSYTTNAMNSTAYFKVKNANPKMKKGIVLYRSVPITESVFPNEWENYFYFEQIVDQDARIYFDINRYCQVAYLYEIDNYSNGIFKSHVYYKVLGLCSFYTTPARS